MGGGLGLGGREWVGDRAGGGRPSYGVFHPHTMSPIQFLVGHSAAGLASRVTSGVSELHLRPKLGPAVGSAETVVLADAEEPMGETQGGHKQGGAQEEQHPLAHTGLLWLQVHAQEVDAARLWKGAF